MWVPKKIDWILILSLLHECSTQVSFRDKLENELRFFLFCFLVFCCFFHFKTLVLNLAMDTFQKPRILLLLIQFKTTLPKQHFVLKRRKLYSYLATLYTTRFISLKRNFNPWCFHWSFGNFTCIFNTAVDQLVLDLLLAFEVNVFS